MPNPLPTRGALDLGPTLTNVRAPLVNELSAVHVENMKDWIIDLATEIGNPDGSTSGSLWEGIASGGGFAYVAVTADATLPSTNAIVDVDTSGIAAESALTITLPAPVAGRMYIVRKIDGGATRTMEIAPFASEMIDGLAATRPLYGSDTLVDVTGASLPHAVWAVYSDGTNWRTYMAAPTTRSVQLQGSAPDDTTEAIPKGFLPGSSWHETSGDAGKLYLQTGNDAADARWIRVDAVDVLAVSADATLPAKDRQVFVDTTAGVVDLTLPSPIDDGAGRQFTITKTNTGTNKITLIRDGSENINGAAASFDLPGSDAAVIGRWHISSDGTDWWVF